MKCIDTLTQGLFNVELMRASRGVYDADLKLLAGNLGNTGKRKGNLPQAFVIVDIVHRQRAVAMLCNY